MRIMHVILLSNYRYIGFFWHLKNVCTELHVSLLLYIHDLGADITLDLFNSSEQRD